MAGMPRVAGKTTAARLLLVGKRAVPPCCRGITLRRFAPARGVRRGPLRSVCFGRLSPASGSRASREVQRPGATSGRSGRHGSDSQRAVHAPAPEAHVRTAQVTRGTFIQCGRSRGSQNRRGGDDGTRSLAVADRNSDPDHPVDLAVWRPSRVKCALSGSQRAGSPRTASASRLSASMVRRLALVP